MKRCVLLVRETSITNLPYLSSDGLWGGLLWITTRDNVWRNIHVSFTRRGLWSAATGGTSYHFCSNRHQGFESRFRPLISLGYA